MDFELIEKEITQHMKIYAKSIASISDNSLERITKIEKFASEYVNAINIVVEKFYPNYTKEDIEKLKEEVKPIYLKLNNSFITTDDLLK